jgi:hypothetical protein
MIAHHADVGPRHVGDTVSRVIGARLSVYVDVYEDRAGGEIIVERPPIGAIDAILQLDGVERPLRNPRGRHGEIELAAAELLAPIRAAADESDVAEIAHGRAESGGAHTSSG